MMKWMIQDEGLDGSIDILVRVSRMFYHEGREKLNKKKALLLINKFATL